MPFCDNSVFWNETILIDNWWPKFTDCFQDTALTFGPCGWLFLTSIVHILYLRGYAQFFHIPTTWLIVLRLLCAAALAFLAVLQALTDVFNETSEETPGSYIGSRAIWAASFTYALFLMVLSQRYGVSSPCIIFIFWVLALISNVVPTYTAIILKSYDDNLYDVTLVFVMMFFLVVEFILQCMGDLKVNLIHPPRSNQPPCSSNDASFPSKLMFSWIFRLVYTGYKKTVTKDDFTDLPPHMQCRNLLPSFMVSWNKEAKKNAKRNYLSSKSYASYSSGNEEATFKFNEKTNLLKGQPKRRSSAYEPPQTEKSKPSLVKVLLKVFTARYIKAQALQLIGDVLAYVNPILLGLLIQYADDKSSYQEWQGFMISGAFFMVVFLNSVSVNFRFYYGYSIGLQVRTVLTAAIYKKSLTMNASSRRQFTVGTMVNLMAVDCNKLVDVVSSLWAIFSCPVNICLAFYFLYEELGLAFLAGIGVLILLIPFNGKLSTLTRNAAAKQIRYKDQRIKMMNEALSGIKVLKLYAWEVPYHKKVEDIRKLEIKQLKLSAIYQSFISWFWLLSPVLMTMTSFVAYVFIYPDSPLTPSKAFVSLSIFNLLKQPMNVFPQLVAAIVESQVSLQRIRNFLSGDDLEKLDTSGVSNEYPIVVANGTFTWDKSQPPLLKNINIEVPNGSLVAVIGQVGAGKSSLLSAILGEMEKVSGHSSIQGSIAYVPQEAWIQNVSLRDNILFSKELDRKHLNKTFKACALASDLKILPGGELTEIGEKGINLSGGQKQRVSLARAVYQDADVYLFDDPLSAVDAHVGKHIFENVVGPKGMLKDRTRILVTHGIHWLPLVDSIIVVDQGRITESGTYRQLMGHDGPFAQFIKMFLLEHENDDDDDPEILKMKVKVMEQVETVLSDEDVHLLHGSISQNKTNSAKFGKSAEYTKSGSHAEGKEPQEEKGKKRDQLIQEEKVAIGKVEYGAFLQFFRAVGYGWIGLILLALFTYNGLVIGAGIWLADWTSDPYLRNESNKVYDDYQSKTVVYISLYATLSLLQVVFLASFIILLLVQFVAASHRMHMAMLSNIFCQAMEFFDTTPLGRILNRFSRDVDDIDVSFSRQLRMVLQYIFTIISVVIIISYTEPIFVGFIIPVLIIYFMFQRFYIPSSRQYRRLESVTRSPILSHFAETISGVSSIRAYKVSERFTNESIDRVDVNNQTSFIRATAVRWLRVRLEILGNFIILFTTLNAVISTDTNGSLVGLSITYALQITQILNILVQQITMVESNAVSIERIVEYSNLPREPDWIIKENRPPQGWPENGKIEFVNYSTRYRSGLDLVLKSISFKVTAGEKIGIVGRTGAGKSSLSMALFRIIEAASGKIKIDGRDISKMGLHDLRSHLTILPQDPVLFSGTLRFNLDPFDIHSDHEVWTALDNAHMAKFVKDFPGQLDYICEEGGQNLSVGQRQLLCLARSLLRKTKVLVLDEATAAVDLETDQLLQETIREAFKDCTILTVAHRLNTVIDYDRILVLSAGEIMEYDSPSSLLQNTNSIFYGMAKDASLI